MLSVATLLHRALMESVAFGSRLILDTMSSRGYRPECITIAGGATRSDLWLQIHADVCNVPFVLTRLVIVLSAHLFIHLTSISSEPPAG